MNNERIDDMPVLTLRERTPAEREAWWQGARHMHVSLLSRLPAAAMVPAEGSFRAEDVAAVFREVGAMFAAVRDLHGEPADLNPTVETEQLIAAWLRREANAADEEGNQVLSLMVRGLLLSLAKAIENGEWRGGR